MYNIVFCPRPLLGVIIPGTVYGVWTVCRLKPNDLYLCVFSYIIESGLRSVPGAGAHQIFHEHFPELGESPSFEVNINFFRFATQTNAFQRLPLPPPRI